SWAAARASCRSTADGRATAAGAAPRTRPRPRAAPPPRSPLGAPKAGRALSPRRENAIKSPRRSSAPEGACLPRRPRDDDAHLPCPSRPRPLSAQPGAIAMRTWTYRDSLETYQVANWGAGFFTINDRGHVRVTPHGPDGPGVDLHQLVEELRASGLKLPMLVRFSDILASRVKGLVRAFARAMQEYGYEGRYRGVYPIKVNQQRHVVEEIVRFGAPHRIGLECGSKPELLIGAAVLDTPGALLICNGYKDRAYIETAFLAQRLGRTPILVIDRFAELELAVRIARELGLRPHLGVRARLTTKGTGKWAESTGERAKFGLSASEIVDAVDWLRAEKMLDCLELLHFHIGSQVSAIRAHKDALREACRIFVGLHAMGAPVKMLDVGGGLGVDYDGSQTNFHSSMNYSVQEYANDVVSAIQEACDETGVPHPDLITEAGRAMTAHHSVLIFDVLGVSELRHAEPPTAPAEDDARPIQALYETYAAMTRKNALE